MKILILDDDMATLTAVKANLEQLEYECKTTTNDKLALTLLPEFDVLITDYQLGSVNGRQVVKNFKSIKPEIEIIMISGYSIDSILEKDSEFRELLFAFHPKPISYMNLSEDLEKIKRKLNLN
ncbi:MAG: response regulator [Candidatus Delongbacteria bacterium]|nr:response regulator [Candidatus Delongbacteria bacterium]MBN2836996.1 response regulator [Candidatus Delongbacteria bacterium]